MVMPAFRVVSLLVAMFSLATTGPSAASEGSDGPRIPPRPPPRPVAPTPPVVPVRPPAAPARLIDVNSASQEALAGLPGMGPELAEQIIAGRPYRDFRDLRRAGLPMDKYMALQPHVRFVLPKDATVPVD
jgi:competence protein ComEA